MRNRISGLLLGLCLVTCVASTAGLDVHVEDAATGDALVSVEVGSPVTYNIVGVLEGGTQGLAVVLFDLGFNGGALGPVDLPSGSPMTSFLDPLGFDGNPFGFTGTPHDGNLLQVGGAQNIFAQGRWLCEADRDCPEDGVCSEGLCSPVSGLPGGELALGVALPGNPAVLASGTLFAPDTPGTYQLQVGNINATAVAATSTGDPFWVTEPVGPITVAALSIEVTEEVSGAPPKIPAVTPIGIAIMVLGLLGAAVYILRRHRF